jgi:hypothetical protein
MPQITRKTTGEGAVVLEAFTLRNRDGSDPKIVIRSMVDTGPGLRSVVGLNLTPEEVVSLFASKDISSVLKVELAEPEPEPDPFANWTPPQLPGAVVVIERLNTRFTLVRITRDSGAGCWRAESGAVWDNASVEHQVRAGIAKLIHEIEGPQFSDEPTEPTEPAEIEDPPSA